jgi:hypothetical protein
MGLSASEEAGHSSQKTSAALLVAWCRICLGKLFLERSDAALGIRDSLLQHENTLDQQVRRDRNLSDLAPNQSLSLGILGLATCLA